MHSTELKRVITCINAVKNNNKNDNFFSPKFRTLRSAITLILSLGTAALSANLVTQLTV